MVRKLYENGIMTQIYGRLVFTMDIIYAPNLRIQGKTPGGKTKDYQLFSDFSNASLSNFEWDLIKITRILTLEIILPCPTALAS